MVMGGYTRGKAMSEEALQKHFPVGGVALRPGVVYGNRCAGGMLFFYDPGLGLYTETGAQMACFCHESCTGGDAWMAYFDAIMRLCMGEM